MHLIKKFTTKDISLLKDESRMIGEAESVAFPSSTKEVLEIMKEETLPITIQGNRTGLAGGAVPLGGLVLNLLKMDKILSLNDLLVSCQAGVLLSSLTNFLDSKNLLLPPDPTETSASIGGMVACNASGARTLRYGPIRPWVKFLKVVLANGEVLELTRGKHFARGSAFTLITNEGSKIKGELPQIKMPNVKNAAGYFIRPNMDLIDLFIGSEGTLGVITEVKLRVLPKPKKISAVTCFFESETEALDYVTEVRKSEVNPAALEYFDENALELLRNERMKNPAFTNLQELPLNYYSAVYTEIHADSLTEQNKLLKLIANYIISNNGNTLHTWLAVNNTDLEQLRYFRHATPEIVNLTIDKQRKIYPKLTKLGTDMAVPDDYLHQVMELYHSDLREAGLQYVIFGHIGDNHLHVNIIPRNDAEYNLGKALYLDWAKQIVAWGGTVSAEHGIGKFKREFFALMYDKKTIAKMKQLKTIFDPKHRLNLGNLFLEGDN